MAKIKAGQVLNPNGRPKGIPDKRTALRALIEPLAPDLIRIVYDLAAGGDVSACRLLLDKCCANIKPSSIPQPVNLDLSGTASEQCQSVLDAIANGTMSLDDGTQLIRAISDTVRVYNDTELTRRIDQLEGGLLKK